MFSQQGLIKETETGVFCVRTDAAEISISVAIVTLVFIGSSVLSGVWGLDRSQGEDARFFIVEDEAATFAANATDRRSGKNG